MTTAEALKLIVAQRNKRWADGRAARNQTPDSPFVGDPREELFEELLDAMNYLSVLTERHEMEPWQIATLEHHLLQAAVLLLTGEGIMFYDQARSQVATKG